MLYILCIRNPSIKKSNKQIKLVNVCVNNAISLQFHKNKMKKNYVSKTNACIFMYHILNFCFVRVIFS